MCKIPTDVWIQHMNTCEFSFFKHPYFSHTFQMKRPYGRALMPTRMLDRVGSQCSQITRTFRETGTLCVYMRSYGNLTTWRNICRIIPLLNSQCAKCQPPIFFFYLFIFFLSATHMITVFVEIPVISVPVRSTPRHPHDFQHMYTFTNSYKYSFFIHTVHQWNLLPPSIASVASLSSFKAAMDSYSP